MRERYEDWEKQQYEIDPEIIDIKLYFFQDFNGEDFEPYMQKNLGPCIKKNFNGSHFERNLWTKIGSEKRYCMDVNDPDIKKFNFSGNLDSYMTNHNVSFVEVNITTCNKFSNSQCKP